MSETVSYTDTLMSRQYQTDYGIFLSILIYTPEARLMPLSYIQDWPFTPCKNIKSRPIFDYNQAVIHSFGFINNGDEEKIML